MKVKKFNINNNYTLEEIAALFKSSRRKLIKTLSVQSLILSILFIPMMHYTNFLKDEAILNFQEPAFIFFSLFFISFLSTLIINLKSISVEDIIFNSDFIEKNQCSHVLKWCSESQEVEKYMVNVRKQCRKLTGYEYLGLKKYIIEKNLYEEKLKEDADCRALYNEI